MDVLFTNPLFLWIAGGLIASPLLIHLLNRRRFREVPWAAMMFLLAANRKSVRRTRLENVLLLLLRTAAIALVPLAMARPVVKSALASGLLSGDRHHILILDSSLSMAAAPATGQPSAFELQVDRAREIIRGLPGGARATLINAAYPARRLNAQPAGPTAAGQLLDSLAQEQTHTDLAGALDFVQQILDAAPAEQEAHSVHILSDFTPGVLAAPAPPGGGTASPASATLLRSLAPRTQLTLMQVSGPAPANLALDVLRAGSPLIGTRRITDLFATVSNYATTRSPESVVDFFVDDRLAAQVSVPALDPQTSREVHAAIEFDTAGLHAVEARLTAPGGNAIPQDDRRRLVLRAREHIPILVVDGKPGAGPLDGHAGYIATALAPRAHVTESTFIDATVVTETELATVQLDRYDILILCNVRRLPERRWQDVEAFVRDGGGLIVFAGDLVDTAHYNRLAAELLPAPLQGLAFSPPSEERFTRFSPAAVGPGLAEIFGGRKTSGLFLARIHQYLGMGPADQTLAGNALLAYENGDLAVAWRQVGAGRCVWCTTSANMEWTNLPAKGDFVTLCMSLLRQAAPESAPERNLIAGDEFIHVTDGAAAVSCTLRTPEGRIQTPDMAAGGRGLRLNFGRLAETGWYLLDEPAQQGPVAVNTQPLESDLRRLDRTEIERQLACEFEWVDAAPGAGPLAPSQGQGASSALLYAALLLLLVEPMVAMAFGYHRH